MPTLHLEQTLVEPPGDLGIHGYHHEREHYPGQHSQGRPVPSFARLRSDMPAPFSAFSFSLPLAIRRGRRR
jgi:hypothetical protein